MKIALLGTRGIPNYHGGFEQFAEYFSVYAASKGHDIYVYNSHLHPYQKKEFNGVKIIHCRDLEGRVGTAGQFVYDLNCILDSRKRNFDVILQLGYTSSSIWHKLLPKNSLIITNMDGLEWKRSKYNRLVQKFLKYAEKLAVKSSDHLIADSIGIKEYLKKKYGVTSKFIAYGATIFSQPDETVLKEYALIKFNYSLLIARLEPENNIETILDGVSESQNTQLFLVIGKHDTAYGAYLKKKYKKQDKILFVGGIYDQNHLNNLRYFSNFYFHGHSVGGTNPSLLEAMASSAFIIANNNVFNKSILEDNSFYFENSADVTRLMLLKKGDYESFLVNNKNKIETLYGWETINSEYEEFILHAIKRLPANT